MRLSSITCLTASSRPRSSYARPAAGVLAEARITRSRSRAGFLTCRAWSSWPRRRPPTPRGCCWHLSRTTIQILFLEHKALYRIKGDVPEGHYTTPLCQALAVREGSDVTIVAAMKMVHEAVAAADELAREGISAGVLDLRTLRPYDAATVLDAVREQAA